MAVTWVTLVVGLTFTAELDTVEVLSVVGTVDRDELGAEVVDTETEAGVVDGTEERVAVGVSETREPVRL